MSFLAPLITQLTATAQFKGRTRFLLATIHDWYFLAGGYSVDYNDNFRLTNFDDVWMSGDLGTTWTLYAGVANSGEGGATGGGNYYVNRVTLGRRLFFVAPVRTFNTISNDVFQLVW